MSSGSDASNVGYGNTNPYINSPYVNSHNSSQFTFGSNETQSQYGMHGVSNNVLAANSSKSGGSRRRKRKRRTRKMRKARKTRKCKRRK